METTTTTNKKLSVPLTLPQWCDHPSAKLIQNIQPIAYCSNKNIKFDFGNSQHFINWTRVCDFAYDFMQMIRVLKEVEREKIVYTFNQFYFEWKTPRYLFFGAPELCCLD